MIPVDTPIAIHQEASFKSAQNIERVMKKPTHDFENLDEQYLYNLLESFLNSSGQTVSLGGFKIHHQINSKEFTGVAVANKEAFVWYFSPSSGFKILLRQSDISIASNYQHAFYELRINASHQVAGTIWLWSLPVSKYDYFDGSSEEIVPGKSAFTYFVYDTQKGLQIKPFSFCETNHVYYMSIADFQKENILISVNHYLTKYFIYENRLTGETIKYPIDYYKLREALIQKLKNDDEIVKQYKKPLVRFTHFKVDSFNGENLAGKFIAKLTVWSKKHSEDRPKEKSYEALGRFCFNHDEVEFELHEVK